MPPDLTSALLVLLGAVLGALATYAASYALEKKKWSADAALKRKEQIYGPIFDELVLKKLLRKSFQSWVHASAHRLEFESWSSIREKASSLEVPRPMVEKLEHFRQACEACSAARADFYDEIRATFPDRHEGIADFAVAVVLGEKMLVAPSQDDDIAYKYVLAQQTFTKDSPVYWSPDQLASVRATITSLRSWRPLAAAHRDYVVLADDLHAEMEKRIGRIVKTLHAPDSKL